MQIRWPCPSSEHIQADPTYVATLKTWSNCVGRAGIDASERSDIREFVNSRIAPRARQLAQAHDTAGLQALLQEEIRLATAAAECEAVRQKAVQPVIRQHESAMLEAHPREFGSYLAALEGP